MLSVRPSRSPPAVRLRPIGSSPRMLLRFPSSRRKILPSSWMTPSRRKSPEYVSGSLSNTVSVRRIAASTIAESRDARSLAMNEEMDTSLRRGPRVSAGEKCAILRMARRHLCRTDEFTAETNSLMRMGSRLVASAVIISGLLTSVLRARSPAASWASAPPRRDAVDRRAPVVVPVAVAVAVAPVAVVVAPVAVAVAAPVAAVERVVGEPWVSSGSAGRRELTRESRSKSCVAAPDGSVERDSFSRIFWSTVTIPFCQSSRARGSDDFAKMVNMRRSIVYVAAETLAEGPWEMSSWMFASSGPVATVASDFGSRAKLCARRMIAVAASSTSFASEYMITFANTGNAFEKSASCSGDTWRHARAEIVRAWRWTDVLKKSMKVNTAVRPSALRIADAYSCESFSRA
eukprot:comp22465_c0_seq3/m.55436 comp22465_c0_seq3/g.55436  ORF comp22465_c0_seq3/g.55436 comp22465_c0_seq3/m.55436 type:complete len:404 (+) comp22465_c0_seq3:892-2103(+)